MIYVRFGLDLERLMKKELVIFQRVDRYVLVFEIIY